MTASGQSARNADKERLLRFLFPNCCKLAIKVGVQACLFLWQLKTVSRVSQTGSDLMFQLQEIKLCAMQCRAMQSGFIDKKM